MRYTQEIKILKLLVTIKDLSFEQAKSRLEVIMAKLEAEQVPMEDLVVINQEAKDLYFHCNKILESIKMKIEIRDPKE